MRILTLFLLTLGTLFGQSNEKPWFFIQMTDTQLGMFTGDQDFVQDATNFDFVVANVNRLKPAFVVITGDLINKPGDPAQIAEYMKILKKFDPSIKVYQIPGNHDVENVPTPASVEAYRKAFGKDYFSFRHGSFAAVAINTTIIHAPQNVTALMEEQKKWLDTELTKLKSQGATQIVIFQHHPWFVQKASEPSSYGSIPLERRQEYIDLLKKHGVKQAFGGHIHKNAISEDGIEMISTSAVGKPFDVEGSGFRVGIVRNGTVEHTFYPLSKIPNQIKLD